MFDQQLTMEDRMPVSERPCPECNGTGRIVSYQPSASGRWGATAKVVKQCPACKGNGRVVSNQSGYAPGHPTSD